MSETEFWWCRKHDRVETAGDRCKARHLLGPYASEADARNWRAKFEARDDTWEAQDDAWDDDSAS